MAIALWFLVGLVGGFLAAVFSGRLHTAFVDILTSLAGSFVGGFLYQQFSPWGHGAFTSWSLLAAAIGSLGFLIVVERFRRRGHSVHR